MTEQDSTVDDRFSLVTYEKYEIDQYMFDAFKDGVCECFRFIPHEVIESIAKSVRSNGPGELNEEDFERVAEAYGVATIVVRFVCQYYWIRHSADSPYCDTWHRRPCRLNSPIGVAPPPLNGGD